MGYEPISPFRRAMDAALTARSASENGPHHSGPAALHVDKWVILREVGTARKHLGVTDRQIAVLQVLLGLRRGNELRLDDPADLVVHPSNATLSTRLNGMPCSTLRRHLARLVEVGLISRRDSPNGKRFVRRYRDGTRDVFGFDLAPLVERAAEIASRAEEARSTQERIARLRLDIGLMRRDLLCLAALARRTSLHTLPDQVDDLCTLATRELRRRLGEPELLRIQRSLSQALVEARGVVESTVLSTTGGNNERHHQRSIEDLPVPEGDEEDVNKELAATPRDRPESLERTRLSPTEVPLGFVQTACPEIWCYAPDGIKDWHHLHQAATRVSPMMGISQSAWCEAVAVMGHRAASIVVAGILQRFAHIRSPGGYLRCLTQKAAAGTFDCRPMITALVDISG